MSKTNPIALLLIILSSAISIASGVWLDHSSAAGTSSYRAVYYGARCIIDHRDPYNPAEFRSLYQAESGALPSEPFHKLLFLRAVMVCVNLPTTLFLMIPLALVPWWASRILWLTLIGFSLTMAALLTFDLARRYAPRLSLLLICLLLANSQVLFTVGNTAGIAVSFCVIAVWCFVRQRFVWLGVLALAISLALKPHDSALIWLWLLFSGEILRRRAIQAALLVLVIAAPAVLVTWHVSSQWPKELAANLSATSSHGDISDPGPDSISRKGSADILIDLQTILSVFRDNSHFYNPAAYTICGTMLSVLLITLLCSHSVKPIATYALACVAALSMLPSYHRPYDAKLLLLAIPACAILRAEGRLLGRISFLITAAAITLTADIPLAVLSLLTRNLNLSAMSLTEKVFALPVLRPTPLVLMILAAFYLVILVKRVREQQPESYMHPTEERACAIRI